MDEVKAISDYKTIKEISEEEAVQKGLFNIIGKEIDDKYIEGRFYFDIKKISKESFSTIIGKNIYLDIDQDDDNEQLDDFGLSTNISNYYSGWNHDYFPGNVTLIFKEKRDKSVLIELHIDDNERNKTLIDYKDYVKISD